MQYDTVEMTQAASTIPVAETVVETETEEVPADSTLATTPGGENGGGTVKPLSQFTPGEGPLETTTMSQYEYTTEEVTPYGYQTLFEYLTYMDTEKQFETEYKTTDDDFKNKDNNESMMTTEEWQETRYGYEYTTMNEWTYMETDFMYMETYMESSDQGDEVVEETYEVSESETVAASTEGKEDSSVAFSTEVQEKKTEMETSQYNVFETMYNTETTEDLEHMYRTFMDTESADEMETEEETLEDTEGNKRTVPSTGAKTENMYSTETAQTKVQEPATLYETESEQTQTNGGYKTKPLETHTISELSPDYQSTQPFTYAPRNIQDTETVPTPEMESTQPFTYAPSYIPDTETAPTPEMESTQPFTYAPSYMPDTETAPTPEMESTQIGRADV